MWLDEAHHFLIAKEGVSIADLIQKTRYEGHPFLWSSLVFIITRFTENIFYMQVMNCLIMTSVCFLFLKHSRLSLLKNIFILCSYFFVYEYLVISRSYSLLLLAISLTFICLKEPDRTKGLIASLLFLPFTHVFGIIISMVICGMLLIGKFEGKSHKKIVIIGIVCVNLIILWSILIPSDHFLYQYDSDSLFSYKRISKTAGMFAKGFLPLPDVTEAIKWNSNFFTNKLRLAGVLLGLLAFLSPVYFFRERKKILALYLIPSLLICVFMHVSPVVISVRYCGILYILFIYIYAFLFEPPIKKSFNKPVIFICTLQFVSGILMYSTDIKQDFSNSKNVAFYIEKNDKSNKTVIISNFSSAPAIACYMHKKPYYAETHEYGTYCKWNAWPFILNNSELTHEIKKHLPPHDSLILILNEHYLNADLHDTLIFNDQRVHYVLAKKFENAMVNNENYSLFYVFMK
ncbi:MAG: hypothetical protein JWO32_2039 [Bacteroidetes bacterium]|nr:hypothetical protein [Bacteroidota bacterium]